MDLEISYKPQYLFTDSDETVRDIMFREKINKKLASTFNLGVLVGKKLSALSGGELQRFSVARCFVRCLVLVRCLVRRFVVRCFVRCVVRCFGSVRASFVTHVGDVQVIRSRFSLHLSKFCAFLHM